MGGLKALGKLGPVSAGGEGIGAVFAVVTAMTACGVNATGGSRPWSQFTLQSLKEGSRSYACKGSTISGLYLAVGKPH